MEHIAALLLIIGCSSDLGECRELPAPIPVYETFEECQGDLPVAAALVEGQAEKILSRCVYVDPALEEEDAELVWDVNPDGTLYAAIETPAVAIASAGRSEDNLSQE